LVTWDPNIFELVPYLSCGGILLTGKMYSSKREITLLNIYGLCLERKRFWNNVADSRLLLHKNLIIAGDLNLTVSTGEVWGGSAQAGPLAGFFKAFFQNNKLIDIQPEKVVPTWRNGRTGVDSIAKRLDRFLISEELLTSVGLYRSWVEYPYVSDHAPVILQLEITPLFKAYPFKLNSQWLLEKILMLLFIRSGMTQNFI
jgi:hypothetical protein